MDTEDISLEDAPTSIDPYAVLSLPTNASEAEIKTAYKKAALRTHPDKAPADKRDEAHQAFQAIALAYAVLSNPARRARYDRTGSTAETLEDDGDFDWGDFFRAQYAEHVTGEKIRALKDEYQGSEEERRDVLRAYEAGKGAFSRVIHDVMLSNVLEDEERLRGYIEDAIKKGEVEAYEKYTGESERSKEKRRQKARAEAKEAEEAAEEMGVHGDIFESKGGEAAGGKKNVAKKKAKAAKGAEMDLAALIQGRAASRKAQASTFLDNLEAKYAGGSNGKGAKKRKMDEPSEEMFAANQKRGKKSKDTKIVEGDGEEEDEIAAPTKSTRSRRKGKA